jgi:hypothetical protein
MLGPILLVAAAIAHAGAVPACKLVAPADAKTVLGGAAAPKAQTLGLYSSCTYRRAGITLTVQTRAISKADFVKSAKANPAPVVAVPGIGAAAYSAAGSVLLVWRNGTEATFLLFGGGKGLADEKALAKRVVSRL